MPVPAEAVFNFKAKWTAQAHSYILYTPYIHIECRRIGDGICEKNVLLDATATHDPDNQRRQKFQCFGVSIPAMQALDLVTHWAPTSDRQHGRENPTTAAYHFFLRP
jgi:hypothetical protein